MNEHCNAVKNRGLPTWPIPMAQFSRPNWPSKGTLLFQEFRRFLWQWILLFMPQNRPSVTNYARQVFTMQVWQNQQHPSQNQPPRAHSMVHNGWCSPPFKTFWVAFQSLGFSQKPLCTGCSQVQPLTAHKFNDTCNISMYEGR